MEKTRKTGQVVAITVAATLVVVGIGVLTWWLLTNKSSTAVQPAANTPAKSTEQPVAPTTPAPPAKYYEGERVTSKKSAFSLVVPNGWKMTNGLNADHVSSGPTIDNIQYNKAKKPTVTDAEVGGWDGYTEFFYVQVATEPYAPAVTPTSLTLDSGLVAKKYHVVTPAGTVSELYGPLKDTYNNYVYVVEAKGVRVEAYFSVFDKTTYDRALIDEVVKSLQIL